MARWGLFTAMTVLGAAMSASAMAAGATVVVNVSGVTGSSGEVRVGLYDQPSQFPKEGRHRVNGIARPVAGKATVRFENIPYGDYAVAVLYDADGDGRMKQNALGVPQEPVGFSAGAQAGLFGPPDFAKARFRVSAPVVTQSVTVK